MFTDYFDCFLKSVFVSLLISINDPASKLSFDYFRTNFMGERLSTTYCRCCETKRHRCEEMVDLCVPLPQDGKFDDNFIKVSFVGVSNRSIPNQI